MSYSATNGLMYDELRASISSAVGPRLARYLAPHPYVSKEPDCDDNGVIDDIPRDSAEEPEQGRVDLCGDARLG